MPTQDERAREAESSPPTQDEPTQDEQGHLAQACMLVDAEDYYRAFYQAAQRAEQSIVIVGWQFDLDTQLLRGEEAKRSELPIRAWALLRKLCERKPQLRVYVLLWDYSFVYVLERQWLVSARAAVQGNPRLCVEWREHPDLSGSYHEKYVIIDGGLAFAGGIDFAETRWDRRAHLPEEPLRWNSMGLSRSPMHDVQAVIAGEAVRELTQFFTAAWQRAAGANPELGNANATIRIEDWIRTPSFPLSSRRVRFARTVPAMEEEGPVTEVSDSYCRLIAEAQRLIYIENQYVTSTAVAEAFVKRMEDASLPKLCIVMVLPDGAESGKERIVLGGQQQRFFCSLKQAAEEHGHDLFLLCSKRKGSGGEAVTTYIHSKLMIVDDRVITVGSANLTNRSMTLDTELNLILCCEDTADLARLRASLMAEHAGEWDDPCTSQERYLAIEGLASRLQQVLDSNESCLCQVPTWAAPDAYQELLSSVFDPCLEQQELDSREQGESKDTGRFVVEKGGVWTRVQRAVRELLSRSTS